MIVLVMLSQRLNDPPITVRSVDVSRAGNLATYRKKLLQKMVYSGTLTLGPGIYVLNREVSFKNVLALWQSVY